MRRGLPGTVPANEVAKNVSTGRRGGVLGLAWCHGGNVVECHERYVGLVYIVQSQEATGGDEAVFRAV